MAQRGKVLRDTSNGKGLISAAGKQYEFTLEGNWKSDISAKVGMIVEFELDSDSNISSVLAVPENQLVKEQAELAMQAAKQKSLAILAGASARVGTSVLIAWGALIVAWFFMDLVSLVGVVLGNPTFAIHQTFWQLLGIANISSLLDFAPLMNAESLNKGIYAFFAIAALTGPAISQFWGDNKAHLGNCLPFIFMGAIFAVIYFVLGDLLSEVIKQQQNQVEWARSNAPTWMRSTLPTQLPSMAQAQAEFIKKIHFGIGAYVALAASAYLAIIGLKRFLVAKAQS